MKTNKKELLDSFKGGLIVSCQVQHDDPTFSVDFVVKWQKPPNGEEPRVSVPTTQSRSRRLKRSGFTSNRALENLAR